MTSHRGGRSDRGAADHGRHHRGAADHDRRDRRTADHGGRDRGRLLGRPFHNGSRLGCDRRSGGSSGHRTSNRFGRGWGRGSHHNPACGRLDILNRATQRVHVRSNVVDLLQVQPWGNRRFLSDRRWVHGGGCGGRSLCRFGFSRGFATVAEMRSDFVRLVVIERAGVRFLVRNSDLGQVLDYHMTLHFQFTRQFVDPNLPHA